MPQLIEVVRNAPRTDKKGIIDVATLIDVVTQV